MENGLDDYCNRERYSRDNDSTSAVLFHFEWNVPIPILL